MLPNDMDSLGKALVRGTSKTVAHATFECPSVRPHIEELVTKESRMNAKACALSDSLPFSNLSAKLQWQIFLGQQ